MGHGAEYRPIPPCISSQRPGFLRGTFLSPVSTEPILRPAPEYQELTSPDGSGAWSLACWEAFDPASKVDLHACALTTGDGRLFFIDPIQLAWDALEELLESYGAQPSGVVLTNGNHARAAADFSRRFRLEIAATAAAAEAAGVEAAHVIPAAGGPVFDGAVEAIPLPGGAAGEVALHRADGGGLLIVGDALINLPSHPLMPLPDKYCENPRDLRRSLATLLERRFAVLAFAHGQPLTANPHARLTACLQPR